MDCNQIEYNKLSHDLHNYAVKNRIPVCGGLELTWRCNLQCVHCYVSNQIKSQKNDELTFKEIKSILDELASQGCLWLLITGGEPLIRKDFLDIYIYAKEKGFIITVFTNGTLLNEEIIDYFAKFPPFIIEISFYGATAKTHDQVTQVSGSFSYLFNGIKSLKKNKIPFRLKTILMSINKHEFFQMKSISEKFGTKPFLYDPIISPRVDCNQEPLSYRLSPNEINNLEMEDNEIVNNWREFIEKSINPYKNINYKYLYNCNAGKTSFIIDPYGNLNLCVISRYPNYNLRKGNFKNGWTFLGELVKEPAKDDFNCKSCKLLPICGQCPGWSQLEYGYKNKDIRLDYLCELANKRFNAFKK